MVFCYFVIFFIKMAQNWSVELTSCDHFRAFSFGYLARQA